MAVKPIPDDRHRVTTYLVVPGVPKLIDFMNQVFGAQELRRTTAPGGRVAHAEVKIGDSFIMMGEPTGEWKVMPGMMYVYVEDVDATYREALAAGATSLMEPADQYHGDRYGGVEDPFGNKWWIATHIEDVSPAEMAKREQAFSQQKAQA